MIASRQMTMRIELVQVNRLALPMETTDADQIRRARRNVGPREADESLNSGRDNTDSCAGRESGTKVIGMMCEVHGRGERPMREWALWEGMSTCSAPLSGSSDAGPVPAVSVVIGGSNTRSKTRSPLTTPATTRVSQLMATNKRVDWK